MHKEGMRERKGPSRRAKITLIVLAILGALVVITCTLYIIKLSVVDGGGAASQGSADGQNYGQINPDLPPPEDVSVTVDKGATIRWAAGDDILILGYNVYRYKGQGDPGSKVNAAIISDNVYHDDEGTMFDSYAVAPVDTNGRQGVVSEPIAAVSQPSSLNYLLTPTQQPEMVRDIVFEGDSAPAGLPSNVVDCTAKGMTYQGEWYLEHYAEVVGGTLMVTPYYGDSCTYTFVGDSVAVVSIRHWNYGIMNVYIDGTLRKEVDLYSPTLVVQDRVFTTSGLGPGAHTIKLVCTGRKNPQAYFTFIDVDTLEIR